MVRTFLKKPEEVDPTKLDLELALTVKLQHLFPNLPEEIMTKLVPRLEAVHLENFGSLLPWNRRKRRRLSKAKHIIVHVFSGEDSQFWERQLNTSTTKVLCVDLQDSCKANLMDRHVFGYLLMLAASGRLRVLLGGPPCRTVSALRSQGDGGPGILRSEDWPYGLPDLAVADAEKVQNDSILFFRYLSLYMVAEEVRAPEDPPTEFLLEQPRDPAEYRKDQDQRQYMSMFRTEEWRRFQDLFNFYKVDFDQGRMGHERCKPATLFTSMASLLELHGLYGPPAKPPEDLRQQPLEKRIEKSKRWAAWAPGLKLALSTAIRQHIQALECKDAARGLSAYGRSPRTSTARVRSQ